MSPKERAHWKNWAGNQQCAPDRIELPASEQGLVRIVKQAAEAGQRIKVAGSGHSFTGIALTDGRLVQLDNYNRVLSIDREKMSATVQAGISIAALSDELDKNGLALENLGDINYQSISGAISTATHGTGRAFGGIATQVTGLRLIAGDGKVIECSAKKQPDVFSAARVGLGALGIISTVTLRCVKAFNLHALEAPMRVDEVLESLDEHIRDNDHFEFFWVPGTGWALTKFNQRTNAPLATRGRWREFRDDILINNVAFGALCRIGRLRPSLIPAIARALPSSGRVEYTDKSYRVFASPRLIRFYEMEYGIPAEAAAEALNRVRSFIKQSGLMPIFPVEVRFTAGDDIPLSTASGRDSCYIAVHVFEGMQYQQYFEAVESIMNDYGGRPHWGKLHFQTAETLAPRYPDWERFQQVRARVDPEGRFSNPYLDRVLGPIRTWQPQHVAQGPSLEPLATAPPARILGNGAGSGVRVRRLQPGRPLLLERRDLVLVLESEVDVVEAVEKAMTAELVGRGIVMDDERTAKTAVVVKLAALEVHGEFAGRSLLCPDYQLSRPLFRDDHRDKSVLEAVFVEDVGKAGADDGTKSVLS